MLNSDKSENIGITFEELRRKYNTMQEIEQERDEKLMSNSEGEQLQFIIAKRLNTIFDKYKEEKGMTKQEFAKELDITPQTLSKYLRAKDFPKPNEMKRLAKILNISQEYLYGLTDSTALIPPKSDLILGLSPEARYSLFKMYHGIEDEDVSEIDIDIPHSNKYVGFLEIFSEFIGNFTYFCDFVGYLKRYVKVKQEINELEENKENTLDYLGTKEQLNDLLIRNRRKITKEYD